MSMLHSNYVISAALSMNLPLHFHAPCPV